MRWENRPPKLRHPTTALPPPTVVAGGVAREQSASFLGRHRRGVAPALAAVLVAGFVYYVVPQIAGLGPTLKRLRNGDPWWLALGVLLEAISYVGEIGAGRVIGWARRSRAGARHARLY